MDIINTFLVELQNHIFGLLIGGLFGIITSIILFFLKPSLSWKWAKRSFPILHGGKSIKATGLSTFSIDYASMEFHELEGELTKTGIFSHVESVLLGMQERVRVSVVVGSREIQMDIIKVEDEYEEMVGLKCVFTTEIAFKSIEDFVDYTVSGRDAINRALSDIGRPPRYLPDIVIHLGWDSATLSILPWMKHEYSFDGSIQVKGADLSMYYSQEGTAVKAKGPSPLLRDVLKNLVVENIIK